MAATAKKMLLLRSAEGKKPSGPLLGLIVMSH
jgi:hypothetical protein